MPNSYDNRVEKSEKADTLGIGLALRALLEAQGITVVMTRTDDSALAGDNYPALGCSGPGWRDVNGDGLKGFGPSLPEATRTRDELSARIDLANVARADLVISIHINSMTQGGHVYQIAATQTFYTDAFPWANASRALAEAVQQGVVRSMSAAGRYARQDRGVDGTAPYLYFLKPAASDPKSPRRALLMPAILAEVGSISLEAESELLAGAAGREAAAKGVYDGIVAFLANRPLAARIALVSNGGAQPTPVPGDGPPFWPELLPPSGAPLKLRLTNTGTTAWPVGLRLAAAWGSTDEPYLAAPPGPLTTLGQGLPALEPGASVEVDAALPAASAGGIRQVAWITLERPDGTAFANLGSPPLQVATKGP